MEDIYIGIVWINMLPEDSLEAALPSIKFLDDKRIQHFYDRSQKSVKQIATSLGCDDKIAWDIYLFFHQVWNLNSISRFLFFIASKPARWSPIAQGHVK